MSDPGNCIYHYDKLIDLLEQDAAQIELAIGGDFPDIYKKIIRKEIEDTRKMKKLMRQQM